MPNSPDCNPSSGSFTIATAQDVSDLSHCTTFTGSIAISSDAPQDIHLDGLQTIIGNLTLENSAIHSLTSPSLQAVSALTLHNLPLLSNLSLPALSNFSTLEWTNLPFLEETIIATGPMKGEIQHIAITNTSLTSLAWLTWPVGTSLSITSNAHLTSFSIPYATINAPSSLTLSSNPSLQSVDVHALTGISGELDMTDNAGVAVLNFSKLETIAGFVKLSGGYADISMGALRQVTGGYDVVSTGDIAAFCSGLAANKATAHGSCTANAQTSGSPPASTATATALSSSTASASARPSSGASRGDGGHAALHIGTVLGIVLSALLFTLFVLVGAFFFFRWRVRAKVREIEPVVKAASVAEEASRRSASFAHELVGDDVKAMSELDGSVGDAAAELEAGHGESELGRGPSVRSVRCELEA